MIRVAPLGLPVPGTRRYQRDPRDQWALWNQVVLRVLPLHHRPPGLLLVVLLVLHLQLVLGLLENLWGQQDQRVLGDQMVRPHLMVLLLL